MNKSRNEPIWLLLIRIITGIIFIFSSFVKGVDPLGTDYRVVDYLEAYGWYSMVDYSFYLAIFLIIIEFIIGVAILFKLKYRLATLGVLMIMIIFFFVTFFDALYNMVPDCGCFGDAIKLSNWETFYKNVVILLFAIILFVHRGIKIYTVKPAFQIILLLLFAVAFAFFMRYNIRHLPVIDFRAWKTGNDMKTIGRETVVNYLAYQNKETGEIKEYISPDYPWNDSVWMSEWEFISQRNDESGLVLKHGLVIEDEYGDIYTDQLIENPDFQFLLAVNDLSKADRNGMIKAVDIYNSLTNSNVSFDMITSSTPDEIAAYADDLGINYPVYYGDDTELKSMIRSNPGLILLKDGIVIKKWHFNDFPKADKLSDLLKDD